MCSNRIQLWSRYGNFLKSSIRWIVVITIFSMSWITLAGQNPPQNLFQQSQTAFYSGDMSRARELIETHIRVSPRDFDARILLSRILVGQGQNQQSFEELRKILVEDPSNMDALFFLASIASALSQQEFGKLYSLAPDSAQVHHLMGESYLTRRMYKEAEEEFSKAWEAAPKSEEAVVALGDIKRTLGDFESAENFYDQALEINPRAYRAVYGLGVCARFGEESEKAIGYFRQAINLAPSYAPAYLALGTSLTREGKHREALEPLLKAIQLEPELDQAYFQIGRAYQALGETEKAKEYLERAQALRMKNLMRFR